jgi:AcrR family transcriptional regulator
MPTRLNRTKGDRGQQRAVPVRARSHASRGAIVSAALALWRANGFAETTVTDICKAAGVSKALFYVYFSRREDVLLAAEIFTVNDAHHAARAVAARPYRLAEVIAAVVETLERQARRYPADLVFEAVMETHRLDRRAIADGAARAQLTFLFGEPFQQAQRDGVLPAGADVERLARLAQILVTDGIRTWAAGEFRDSPLSSSLAADVADIVTALTRR